MKKIVVPKNREASQLVYHYWGEGPEYVSWTINQDEFNALWKYKIFELLNKYTAADIDEYEEEMIDDYEKLVDLKEKLLQVNMPSNVNLRNGLQKLNEAVGDAVKFKTSIHFFL